MTDIEPSQHPPPKKRRRIVIIILLSIVALIAGGYYYCFIDRVHTTTRQDGWLLEFSFPRCACRHCLGSVEQLTYQGRAVPKPSLTESNSGDTRFLGMICPVGYFVLYVHNNEPYWRNQVVKFTIEQTKKQIAEHELTNGYYIIDPTYENSVYLQKMDTPKDWCLIFYEDNSAGCWLRPDLIKNEPWTGLLPSDITIGQVASQPEPATMAE